MNNPMPTPPPVPPEPAGTTEQTLRDLAAYHAQEATNEDRRAREAETCEAFTGQAADRRARAAKHRHEANRLLWLAAARHHNNESDRLLAEANNGRQPPDLWNALTQAANTHRALALRALQTATDPAHQYHKTTPNPTTP